MSSKKKRRQKRTVNAAPEDTPTSPAPADDPLGREDPIRVEGQTPISRRRAGLLMTMVLGFIAIQFALPISPFLVEPHVTRTDFTWDMFAVRRDCERCMLTQSINGNAAKKIGWGYWFRSPYHVARSRNQQRLPQLAREFCRANQGRYESLDVRIVCECRYNKSETLYNLDPFGGNYCSAEAARRFD